MCWLLCNECLLGVVLPAWLEPEIKIDTFGWMQVVRRQAAFAKQHGLFKATSAWDVIFHLICPSVGSSYNSLGLVDSVDYFISHTWSCRSWMKSLAFCHHFNLDFAIASSFLSCIFSVVLLILYAGSWMNVARECQDWLNAALLYIPMTIFFIAFFFGHSLARKTFWLDAACVNQANVFEKAATLQALPAFVANSSQMLVLWDDRYFERLWCIYVSELCQVRIFSYLSFVCQTCFISCRLHGRPLVPLIFC